LEGKKGVILLLGGERTGIKITQTEGEKEKRSKSAPRIREKKCLTKKEKEEKVQ